MLPEWEALREAASQIKNNVLSNLNEYLLQFEKNATQNCITVHWAADDKEHNQIVHSILKQNEINRIVKSKAMLTEECHLNDYLKQVGIDVVDTDQGERIILLANEAPSHFLSVPIIYEKRITMCRSRPWRIK